MSSHLRTGPVLTPDVPAAPSAAGPGTGTDGHGPSGADSVRRLGSVFWTSVGVSAVFVAWAVLFTDNLNEVTTSSLGWVTESFGWTYLVVTLGILVFLVFLAFSPAG